MIGAALFVVIALLVIMLVLWTPAEIPADPDYRKEPDQ